MHRSLMSLSILILAVVLIATSCSSSKENDSKTTTTGNESVIFLAKDCPEDTGFCANFPSSYEKKALQAHDPATSDEPAHTSYYTEVYPGEEIEQYVVKVYDDDPGGQEHPGLDLQLRQPMVEVRRGDGNRPADLHLAHQRRHRAIGYRRDARARHRQAVRRPGKHDEPE